MTTQDRIDLILGDWEERRERGEAVTIDGVIREHPDLADELQARFAAIGLVDVALAHARREGALVPPVVGDFRVGREVGRGGMGVVYEAEQISMGRVVALKILSDVVASNPQSIQRFRREARAAGRIHHTNVAPVYGMGHEDGRWFYAMELVAGLSVNDVIRELKRARRDATPLHDSITSSTLGADSTQPEFFRQIARMFAGVAHGLHAAHTEGVIHRDVKPSNLILTPEGEIKIVDFGLARLEADEHSMTLTGNIIGTPAYMSPEQTGRSGDAVDARTDTYSLGATLYEVLTLETPFQADSWQDLWAQITTTDPDAPRRKNAAVPRDLETIVVKAMEKEPGHRYATTEALARDLERFADGAPIAARPISFMERAWRKMKRHKVRSALTAASLVLIVLATALGFFAREEGRRRRLLEYEGLVRQGERALAAQMSEVFLAPFDKAGVPRDAEGKTLLGAIEHEEVETRAYDAFTEAVALELDRPEALWLRALTPGRTVSERFQDLEAARAHGLDAHTASLTKLYLRAKAGGLPRETIAAVAADPPEVRTPMDAVFVAYFQFLEGHIEASLTTLGRATEMSSADSASRYLALRLRAGIRDRERDHVGALQDLQTLIGLGEDTPVIRFRIAKAWKRKGDMTAANRAFEEVLAWARRRSTVEAWQQAVTACGQVASGTWYDPITAQAIVAHPDDPLLLTHRADALSRKMEFAEADRLLDRALRSEPGFRRALLTRAWVRGRAGDEEGAVEVLRRIASDDHVTNERLGHVLHRSGRSKEAIPYLERAHQQSPTCAGTLRELAAALGDVGRVEEGRAHFDRLVGMNPTSAMYIAERGAFRANREHDEVGAREDFEASLRWKPKQAFSHGNLGVITMNAGRLKEARGHFEKAFEYAPDRADYMESLVSILLDVEDVEAASAVVEQNAERFAGSASAQFALSKVRLAEGDPEAAQAAARAAHSIDPKSNDVRWKSGVQLARAGDETGLTWMQEALAERETAGRANTLGNTLDDLGRADDAIRAWKRSIELDPGRWSGYGNLGKYFHRIKAFAKALPYLDDCLALMYPSPEMAEMLAFKAECHAALGQLDAARPVYDQCVAMIPDDPSPYVDRGGFRADRLKDLEGAHEDFDKALELDPEHLFALTNRGIVFRRQGKGDEAIEAWRKALGVDATHLKARHLLAGLLMQLQRFDEAANEYRVLAEQNAEKPFYSFQLAQAFLSLGRHAEALPAYAETLRREPKSPRGRARALNGVALCREALGEQDDALVIYGKVSEVDPSWAWPHWCRGDLLFRLERYDEAIEAYEQAGALDPKWPWPHNDIGVIHLAEHRDQQAYDAFSRAIVLDETYMLAWQNRTQALVNLERLEEAVADAKHLLAVQPKNGTGLSLMGDALWHLGKHREALKAFDELDRLAPSGSWALRMSIDVLFELEAFDEALERAEDGLRRFPEHLGVRMLLLSVLNGMGDEERVRALARRWVGEHNEEDGPLWYARVCVHAGDGPAARRVIEALELADDDAHARYHHAAVYALLGDVGRVEELLGEALEGGLWLPPGAALAPEMKRLQGRDPELDRLLEQLTQARRPGPAR